MVCDGILYGHRILKTVNIVSCMSVAVLSNKFSKQKFMFYFYCQKQFCEQFLCCFDILWLRSTPSHGVNYSSSSEMNLPNFAEYLLLYTKNFKLSSKCSQKRFKAF